MILGPRTSAAANRAGRSTSRRSRERTAGKSGLRLLVARRDVRRSTRSLRNGAPAAFSGPFPPATLTWTQRAFCDLRVAPGGRSWAYARNGRGDCFPMLDSIPVVPRGTPVARRRPMTNQCAARLPVTAPRVLSGLALFHVEHRFVPRALRAAIADGTLSLGTLDSERASTDPLQRTWASALPSRPTDDHGPERVLPRVLVAAGEGMPGPSQRAGCSKRR